jgi:histone H3/H4
MAAKKKAGASKGAAKKGGGESMIISKSRVKAAAKKSNVGSEFYGSLEAHVRSVIAQAEARAAANGRKTLRPQDV